MSRRRRHLLAEQKAEMTPLIDVTFLLLIFFLVTLQFRTLEGRLDAALPKDQGLGQTALDPIEKIDVVIEVVDEGRLVPDPETGGRHDHYVGRVVRYRVGTHAFVDLGALRSFFSGLDPGEQPVTIDARGHVVHGDALAVLDLVTGLGFEEVAVRALREAE